MKRTGKPDHQTSPTDSGFTLVELLAVIAIIGLLAAIALPAISKIRDRAQIGTVKAQLAQIETAIEGYYAEWDTYPPMGNDWVGGAFFANEDVGNDRQGPFALGAGGWEVNGSYTGPDTDGTEGNYVLDEREDIGLDLQDGTSDAGEGNGRLDGTYYDRLGMFTDPDKQALIDLFADKTYYHYYGGYVTGSTAYGMMEFPSYAGVAGYLSNHPAYYNRWVIYSVGPDGIDHGLHNYYLVMQNGEDLGEDAYAGDPSDQDTDLILFEPSPGENNGANTALVPRTIVETQWLTAPVGNEGDLPPGSSGSLESADGKPVFSYDVRMERRRSGKNFVTPDGNPASMGMIMRYGP
jgi:general secretion pathway protein G